MAKQSKRLKSILFTLLFSSLSSNASATNIYFQGFDGQLGTGVNGASLNNFPVGGWTVDTSNANLQNAGDYIRVRGNSDQRLVAQDVRGTSTVGSALWLSPLINIFGAEDLFLSVDVFKTGGVMEPDDFVTISYILDSGPAIIVQMLNDDFADTLVSSSIASGFSTLQILAEFGNGTGGIEQYAIDNVLLTGTVPEPATLALLGIGLAGISYKRKKA